MNTPVPGPCPFCGVQGTLDHDATVGWFVGCANADCPADAFVGPEETAEDAVKKWNRRSGTDETMACPFCGGGLDIEDMGEDDYPHWIIACCSRNSTCEVFACMEPFRSRDDAVDAWTKAVQANRGVEGATAEYGMWIAFGCECDICGQIWAGVAPVGAVEAECPSCAHFNAIPDGWKYANEAEGNENG